jgi:hypothetical protein
MADRPEPWWIYHAPKCPYTKPEPMPKLVVVVTRDTYARGFLINTEIDPWIAINPSSMRCQVRIRADEHPCLDYDSWVDCTDLFRFEDWELPTKRNPVSTSTHAEIIEAVRRASPSPIVGRYRRAILEG